LVLKRVEDDLYVEEREEDIFLLVMNVGIDQNLRKDLFLIENNFFNDINSNYYFVLFCSLKFPSLIISREAS
jgi:hypothetical protein